LILSPDINSILHNSFAAEYILVKNRLVIEKIFILYNFYNEEIICTAIYKYSHMNNNL